jgi:hypothetical protein
MRCEKQILRPRLRDPASAYALRSGRHPLEVGAWGRWRMRVGGGAGGWRGGRWKVGSTRLPGRPNLGTGSPCRASDPGGTHPPAERPRKAIAWTASPRKKTTTCRRFRWPKLSGCPEVVETRKEERGACGLPLPIRQLIDHLRPARCSCCQAIVPTLSFLRSASPRLSILFRLRGFRGRCVDGERETCRGDEQAEEKVGFSRI